MEKALKLASAAMLTGTVASVLTTVTLVLLARASNRGAVQPTNSTSHWLHGETAGLVRDVDVRHTALGYATHHASAAFWALPFQAWLSSRPPRQPLEMLRDASVMSAVAAVVDYGLVPKRLTPGWETVLPKRAIAATYVAMALGLAAGALVNQRIQKRSA
jgi:hypothetical protein